MPGHRGLGAGLNGVKIAGGWSIIGGAGLMSISLSVMLGAADRGGVLHARGAKVTHLGCDALMSHSPLSVIRLD